MLTRRLIAVAAAGAFLLAGCSGDDEPDSAPTFEAPRGIELATPGTESALGQTVTVAHPDTGTSGTALALGVASVQEAPAADLALFSTPAGTKAFYVTVSLGNRGPNPASFDPAVPWWLHISGDVLVPPSAVPASFDACAAPKLEEPMPAGASTRGCLLFLVPADATVESVDFQPGDVTTAVRWTP